VDSVDKKSSPQFNSISIMHNVNFQKKKNLMQNLGRLLLDSKNICFQILCNFTQA